MTEAYIFDAVRTPRGKGKKDGSLHQATPVWLLSTLLRALQQRNKLDTSLVDDLVLGCVTPVGEQGADIARTAILDSGWDQRVAGVTLSRFCASGLEAVNQAAQRIGSGMEDMIVAGGVESMSRWPMGSDGGAWVMDPRINSGTAFVPQGISADLIASLEGFSRHDLDSYASESHRRAAQAQAEGRFDKSIVPVKDLNGLLMLAKDETVRAGTTPETLAKLMPSFEMMGTMGFDATALDKYTTIEKVTHSHHAGNSSGIVDGAALILLGSKEAGIKAGLKPRAKVRMCSVIGSEPTIMLTGPTPACRKALNKLGMTPGDIDLWEINEAFATVPMKTARDLNVPLDRVNVNGGAIALGHPLGMSGARLAQTLVHQLQAGDGRRGMASLCIGVGMGLALAVERV